MKNINKVVILAILTMSFISFGPHEIVPNGWHKAGSHSNLYNMCLDDQEYYEGTQSGFIESVQDNIPGFGTLMQTCSAKGLVGKRIKMTGYLKCENVEYWSGLWLRIDGTNNDKTNPLGFDNMYDRQVKGTTDWKKYEIIMEVPATSTTLNFGALLTGTGKVWFDNITFEEISSSNGKNLNISNFNTPININFED